MNDGVELVGRIVVAVGIGTGEERIEALMLVAAGNHSLVLRVLPVVLRLLGEEPDTAALRRHREGMDRRTWSALLVVTAVVVGSSFAGLDHLVPPAELGALSARN